MMHLIVISLYLIQTSDLPGAIQSCLLKVALFHERFYSYHYLLVRIKEDTLLMEVRKLVVSLFIINSYNSHFT